ncbi:MAG: hypothetical protein Q7S54_00360 [bacterium]|nr:hypothetical protein [bacterium]
MPATVIVPVRAGPLFSSTMKVSVQSPFPLVAEVILIQEALLTADHAQAACVVMLTLPWPPSSGKLKLVGETPYVQVVGGPGGQPLHGTGVGLEGKMVVVFLLQLAVASSMRIAERMTEC